MHRRRFLQNLAATTAAIQNFARDGNAAEPSDPAAAPYNGMEPGVSSASGPHIDIEGHTLVCEFKIESTSWKVYEDLRTRDGSITFVSSRGGKRVLAKSAEATFAEAESPYLGLSLKDIGMTGRDLVADRLLEKGDPDPEVVKSAAPPQGSAPGDNGPFGRFHWDTFVGTKECFDTMPVYPLGSTRTYHPVQYFPELYGQAAKRRFDGLIGGWMPAVRKVMPIS